MLWPRRTDAAEVIGAWVSVVVVFWTSVMRVTLPALSAPVCSS
jgi:hypothetical protein